MWGTTLLDPQDRLLHGFRNSFPLSDRHPMSFILSRYLRALRLKMRPRSVSKQSRWSHKWQDFGEINVTSNLPSNFFAGIYFTFAPSFGLLWSCSAGSLFSLARSPLFHDVTISPLVLEIPANRKWGRNPVKCVLPWPISVRPVAGKLGFSYATWPSPSPSPTISCLCLHWADSVRMKVT